MTPLNITDIDSSLFFLDNRPATWLLVTAVIVTAMVALKIAKNIAVRRLEIRARKTTTQLDDLAVDLLRKSRIYLLFFLALYAAVRILRLPTSVVDAMRLVAVVAVLFQLAFWGNVVIQSWVSLYTARKEKYDGERLTTVSAFGFLARLTLWSLIILVALDNIGVNVTALIAGLGVTGVAVALAVQNILGDLFASLSIVLDKPFVLGDFIVVDNYMGTIEYIGIKTTRMRSLFGEEVVFSNADLLRSRIRNYRRMQERRVTFVISVTYENGYDNLKRIPGVLREIVEAQPHARFERAHFKAFRDFALDFEIAYFVDSPDYQLYMDTQQAVNLAVFRRFHELGIELAHQGTAHTQPLPSSRKEGAL